MTHSEFTAPLQQELSEIAAALKERLAWAQRHGCYGLKRGAEVSEPLAPEETGVVTAAAPLPAMTLPEIRADLGDCQRCRLAEGRTHIVFGTGNPQAELMFIGEGPGFDEDKQGEPFVGAAGQLLNRMIAAMGLSRNDVYIANIVKCRPPQNRNPLPDEIAACEPFVYRQIAAVRPRLIVALGNIAAKTLLRTDLGITRLRGSFHDYQGIPLMPTFHPAYLLRNPDGKRPAWDDLQMVMAEMDRLGLQRSKNAKALSPR